VRDLTATALQADTGIALAGAVVENLRTKAILLPKRNAIENNSQQLEAGRPIT